jgi:hypothetical protein
MMSGKLRHNLRVVFLAATLAFSLMFVALAMSGCASDRHKPSADYPFPKMLDPVTEDVPNVKVK